MSSIKFKALSLAPETQFQNPKHLSQSLSLSNSFKPPPHRHSFQLTELHISPKFRLFCGEPSIPYIPISNFSRNPCFFSTESEFLKVFSVKIVVFLVGSFFFLGCFNTRTCAALPANTSSSGANSEGLEDIKREKSEEEEEYEKLLEKEPMNVEALKVLVYGKMRRGRTNEASKYVERLIDIEPGEVEWRLLQALCYETMGDLSNAKKLFKEILKERPLLLRALHGLALVMHKNHEGPAVFEMLHKALTIAHRERRVTEERNIKILIAQMHVVVGELEEGLLKFQDLIDENPQDFRPYLCQGIILSLQNKKKEAEEQFELYESLVPEEFAQRGFLDDVVLAAKTESQEQLQKEFEGEFTSRKTKSREQLQKAFKGKFSSRK
ncbi:protein SLOW GREEN 1 chloroplastic isoform X2 [Tripterygium wilfordii]|uniref:Protein SLOW GREEN 1 chloroplastic isoform X2 n=1 Tax=Tripterygium wilfordii TaxID=458696 RepID=A0A7J7C0K8_TRIWF|nr:protein SLOW GREEN 1, chloroplastic [Tripterygium wilfordii]KAF5727674.1 protein SLOW GREEN 1 chloroplastic isoform X2 [Tripterygium wilfordii]